MTTSSELVFGIISSAPAARIMLDALCEELTKRTESKVAPRLFRSYEELGEEFRKGGVHVAWAPPLVAIDLEQAGTADVVLCSARGGKTSFATALFAKADGPKSVDELEGKSVAWVAKESSAGYVVPRLKLAALGFDVSKLGEESFRRTHEAVVKAVLAGEADVGATYVHLVDGSEEALEGSGWKDAGASDDDVNVLFVAGPIPSDAIAISRKLEKAKAKKLTKQLTSVGESAPAVIKGLLNADRFEPIAATHFDNLRQLVKAASEQTA